MVDAPQKMMLMFETSDGKRDFSAVGLGGLPIALYAGITELKAENRVKLTNRVRKEVSAFIDRTKFPRQEVYDIAVAQTADQMIAAFDQHVDSLPGVRVTKNDKGQITKTMVHQSLGDLERRAFSVLHDQTKFRAPFLLKIADREGLRFAITEKEDIASLIPLGQRDPHVEGRTAHCTDQTGQRLYQIIYAASNGPLDNAIIPSGSNASPMEQFINAFAHETIHNTKLDKLLSSEIRKQGESVVDKLISDDIARLKRIDAQIKKALTTQPAANATQAFASMTKDLEMRGALAPLFELAVEGFDNRTRHSQLSVHDLRRAVQQGHIPDILPSGVTIQNYIEGLQDVAARMSQHLVLPIRMMQYFPPDRYPNREAVLNEYPGQVFSIMALKGLPVTEVLLPNLTPLLSQAVKHEYEIDIRVDNNVVPLAAKQPRTEIRR